VCNAAFALARHVTLVGLGEQEKAHGFTIIVGDGAKLMQTDERNDPLIGGPQSFNPFGPSPLHTAIVTSPGILSDRTVLAAFKEDGAVAVDCATGQIVCQNFLIGNILKGAAGGGARHKSASAVAQQVGGCLVIKAKEDVAKTGVGAFDVFFAEQQPTKIDVNAAVSALTAAPAAGDSGSARTTGASDEAPITSESTGIMHVVKGAAGAAHAPLRVSRDGGGKTEVATHRITLKWAVGKEGAKTKKKKLKVQSSDSYGQVQTAVQTKHGSGAVLVSYEDEDEDVYEMEDDESWQEMVALALDDEGMLDITVTGSDAGQAVPPQAAAILAPAPASDADDEQMVRLQVLAGQSPEFQDDVKAAIEQFRSLGMAAIQEFIFAPPKKLSNAAGSYAKKGKVPVDMCRARLLVDLKAVRSVAFTLKGTFEECGFQCDAPKQSTGKTDSSKVWWKLLVMKPLDVVGKPIETWAEVQICDPQTHEFLADHTAYEKMRGYGPGSATDRTDNNPSAALCVPGVINAELGERLRRKVREGVPGEVEAYYPRWVTSYATGRRDVDAEGCGPGMWLNELLIQRAVKAGFEVPMTGMLFTTGNWHAYMLRLNKKNCAMMGEQAAEVLVVLLTVPLFNSAACLDEIAAALDSKMKVVVLRCEDPLRVDETEMWPVPQGLKDAGDRARIQEYMLKRQPVVGFLAAENSIPTPGNSVLTSPSAFGTFLGVLGSALGVTPRGL
jgi:hypothetical protein